jgi:signal transduction histidine kinase/ActR/RegA family two-component response regulator
MAMTSPLPPSADLEKERLGLLRRMDLAGAGAASAASERLGQARHATLRTLLGSPLECWLSGLSPLAATPLLDLLSSSEAGKQQAIAFDIALIHKVLGQQSDVISTNAFGLTDAAFPVVIEERVIGCLWQRGYRTRPFRDVEIAAIADASASSLAAASEIAEASPLVTPSQSSHLHQLAGSARDAIAESVRIHLDARSLEDQLLQSERTRALGTLSGGVAHRFNNLLSIILGYSSFVLNRERLSIEAEEALKKISNAAQQGRRLTEEILSFAGSEVEQETLCPVHSILGSILSLLQSQYSSRILVRTELLAASDQVLAPPSSIHQLVFNLLSNAFDSMPQGGSLVIGSSIVRGQLTGKSTPYLSLVVSDSSGVMPADAEAAVEDSSVRRTSLKLSQADGIAGALQGSVTVISRPGAETSVEVRLPLAVHPAPSPAHPPQPRGLDPAVIWVVDDDAIFREMCQKVLGEAGHTVEALAAGRELLTQWQSMEIPPDLIIIDFSMPEYNGLELCTWLKEHGCEAPIVLVSGFTQSQPDIHRALEYRKTYFLRKPFSFREMMDTVTIVLGESLIHQPVASNPDSTKT